MAEKLTKTALKSELTRRIEWFEKAYPNIHDIDNWNAKNHSPLLLLEAGRYLAYNNMREQIESGFFIGGGK